MAVITILKSGKKVQVPDGSNLMEALLSAGLPVASSCGGEAVCLKCCLKVVAGQHNLSLESQTEQELREINNISKNLRISCQTLIFGDVTLDATYW